MAGSRWRAIADDLLAAWRVPAVKRGCLGTLLLFIGSITPGYLPQSSPWWGPARALGLDNGPARAALTALVVVGVALLVEAWFRLRPPSSATVKPYATVKHWAVIVIWSIPLLIAPPIFSHDAYAYAAEGWLLRNGLNPYYNSVSVLPGAFADQVAWVWRYTPAMYPPLSLRMFESLVVLAQGNPYYSTIALRIPALLGMAMLAYFLPRIARSLGVDPTFASWFGVLNPIVLVDFVGGLHNDSIMVGLTVLALWLVCRNPKWFWVSAMIVGAAACIKQPAALAVFPIALVGHPWTTLRRPDTLKALGRLALCAAIVIATFAAISFVCGLGYGWIPAASVPGEIITMAPFMLLGSGVQWVVTAVFGSAAAGAVVLSAIRTLGLVGTVLAIAWLGIWRARRRPFAFLAWSYLAFAFGGLAMYSWYLTWGGVMLPLARPGERTIEAATVLTAVLLVYEAANLAYRNEAVVGLATGSSG